MALHEIIVVINGLTYPYIIGGAEIFAHSLSNELSRIGYDVTLLGYRDTDGKVIPSERRYRIITTPSVGRFLDRLVFPIHASVLARRLGSSVNENITLSIMLHSSLLGRMIAKKLSSECHIVSLSGGDAAISSMTGVWFEKVRIDYYLYSRLAIHLNKDAVFIVTTEVMRKQMVKAGVRSDRIVLIPRFVEDRFFQVNPVDCILKGNDITFIGRLSEIKGIRVLLEAFNAVIDEVPNAKLRLVGDGPLKSFVMAYIREKGLSENVALLGTVPFENVHELLSNSTILVLPSLNEGLPNVLIQAMAAGLPIVASRVGGIPEVIDDGVNGILVAPGSPEDLARGIIHLLEDRREALRMGQSAKRSAERYRADRIVKKYINLFERCSRK